MAKGSGMGSARVPTTPPAYLTLWLGGEEHHILSWKMPIARHPLPAGIERGKPMFGAVPSLSRLLAPALQAVRSSGNPTMVTLPTPAGPLACFCTPAQPEPHTDPIICAIPLAFFAGSKEYDAERHLSEAHEAAEQATSTLLQALPLLAMHLDSRGQVRAINAPLSELLSLDVGQQFPLTLQQLHPSWQQWANDDPYRWCDLPPARALQRQHPIEEFMIYRSLATEERRPFLAKALPTLDDMGTVNGVDWLLIPVTAQVYADGIAHRRASEILSVIESMRDGIMLYDDQGKLWLMNPAAREMLGWDRLLIDPIALPQAMRAKAYASQHNDGTPLTDEDLPMYHALRGESTEVIEVSMKRLDGVRINVGISASPLRDAEGTITGAVAVTRDMTLHHRFEKMREGFISLASHELRTPLTSLVLAQRIMQGQLTRFNAPASLLDLNSDLLSQLRQLNRLVDNMLDMTGLTGGNFELRRGKTDLTKLLHDVIAELHLLHKRTPREIVPSGFGEALWLHIDPQRFSQVLYNLIANAIKFSPATNPIEIEAHYFTLNDAPWLTIDIIDAGVGIPQEQLHTLFDRVVESEEISRTSGMGYSLYLSRAIMRKHGGTITANSVMGFGSTFSIRLPLAPPNVVEPSEGNA